MLTEHVANDRDPDRAGHEGDQAEKVTPRKNDACVALVMAVAMAMQEAPKPYVRPRSPGGLLMPDSGPPRNAPGRVVARPPLARLEAASGPETFEAYYDGHQPLAFASQKFRDAFGSRFREFSSTS